MKASDQELYVTQLTDLIAKINAFIEQELQGFLDQSKIYQSTAISEEGYKLLNKLHRKLKRITDDATSLIEKLNPLISENKETHNQDNSLHLIRQKTKVMEADARSCIKEARNVMKPITGFTVAETELLDLQSRYNKFLGHEKYSWTIPSKSLLGSDFKKMSAKFQSLALMYQHITEQSNQKIKKISAEKIPENIKIEKKVEVYKSAINEMESFDEVYRQASRDINEKINSENNLHKQISDYYVANRSRNNYLELAKKALNEFSYYGKKLINNSPEFSGEKIKLFFKKQKNDIGEIANNHSVDIDSKIYKSYDEMTKYRLATQACNSDSENLKLLIEILQLKSQNFKDTIEKQHDETKNIQNNRIKALTSQIDKINTSFSALFVDNLVKFQKDGLEVDTLYEKASVLNELYNQQATSLQEHEKKLKKLVQYTNSFSEYAQKELAEPLNKKLRQLEEEIKPKLSELRKNTLSSSLTEPGKNILLKQLDKLIIPPEASRLSNREVLLDTLNQLEVSSKSMVPIQKVLACINDECKNLFILFKSIGSQEDKVTFLHTLSEAAPNLHDSICKQIEGNLAEFAKDDIPIIIDYFRERAHLPNSLKNKLAFIEIAINKNLSYAEILKEDKHYAIKTVSLLAESGLNHAITEQLIRNPIFCSAVITLKVFGMLNEQTITPLLEAPNRGALINFYLYKLEHSQIAKEKSEWTKFGTETVKHFLRLDSGTVNLLKGLIESLKEPTASQLLQPRFLIFANTSPTLLTLLNSQSGTELSANANFLIDILDNAKVLNMHTDQFLVKDDNEWEKHRISEYFNEKEASLANLLALNKVPDKLHQMLEVRNQINQALVKLEEKYADKPDAMASFTNFKSKMLPILLTPGKNEDKKGQLLKLAHQEFKHRHAVSRILDDIIHIINRIFGSGIQFFSPAKTKREVEVGKTISESLKQTPPAG